MATAFTKQLDKQFGCAVYNRRMMREIAKLTAGSNGELDPADYERTVATLMKGGSDPVITKKPSGAWTHMITDKAL